MKPQKQIFLLTNGCPENRIDTARLQAFFSRNGWQITDDIRQADVILFNTCALNEYTEAESIQLIRQLQSLKRPSCELIVYGCLPKINETRLRGVHHGLIVGSDEMGTFDDRFDAQIPIQDVHANCLTDVTRHLQRHKWVFFHLRNKGMLMIANILLDKFRRRRSRATDLCASDVFPIKISTGCLGNCSFCAVRLSRGQLKSKAMEDVRAEFEDGLKKGYRRFSLIGTEVGFYGKDCGTDIVALLDNLLNVKGDYEIMLRNINPVALISMLPRMLESFRSGRIAYLACAAESGNDRILRLMNRRYSIEEFRDAVGAVKRECPHIEVHTQLMVGFPTETESEFQDTRRLLDEVDFDYVEVYMFQPRPGTEAAALEGQVPEATRKRRYLSLMMKLLLGKGKAGRGK